MNPPAYRHNGQPVDAAAFYRIACDPRRHVAVQACAGAGKTWMLVSRILRALLDGTPAQDILAITFTKKAAGEMRQRLHQWLAEFAQASLPALEQELRARGFAEEKGGIRIAQAATVLQNLYQTVLDSGRNVQIRTFHSWFATLLRHAPLSVLGELGLPAQYELLEDDSQAVALVWPRWYARVAADAIALDDFEQTVQQFGRTQALKALATALSRRIEFGLADAGGVLGTSVQPFATLFPVLTGLAQPEAALADAAARARWLARAKALGAESLKTPRSAAQGIVDAFDNPDLSERLRKLRKAFFVEAEDRLTQHLKKFPTATDAETELQTLCAASAQHQAWLHQQRMTRLSRLLIDEFAQLKRERGWIDMNDVERAAQRLLTHPELSGWLQQKLDARVRHLLIDEFQDTSPLQWQTLSAWLTSYAGSGAGDAPQVFIVGDPKQSIYRFRRAEPQVFVAALGFMVQGLRGDLLECDHTRRNAPGVVDGVNAVMLAAQDAGEFDGYRAHTTAASVPGGVYRLPVIGRDALASGADPAGPGWRNSLTTPRVLPEESWRQLECRQAARWVANELAQGLAANQIMVLARKRVGLAAMQEALRALQVPATQPEKLDLGAAPEVQDLIALLDVLLSPQHDLSLAQALKSPLFGASDNDLVLLAAAQAGSRAQRPELPVSWFELLQTDAALPAHLQAAGRCLCRWQSLLQQLPPHDALQSLYAQGDVLARFAAAAPQAARSRVLGNLRALLAAALAHQGGRFATPYALVRALKSGQIKAPASSRDDAVQLLTVHGAKGLEAHTVLLLDTDAKRPRADTMATLIDWPGQASAPTRFTFLLREKKPPLCNRDALAAELAARQREELNGLYVAMTRAKQRLVLSSVAPAQPQTHSGWARLAPLAQPLDMAALGALPVSSIEPEILLLELPFLHTGKNFNAPENRAKAEISPATARIGEAMHRLLEWLPTVPVIAPAPDAQAWPVAQQAAVAREFMLDPGQLDAALGLARAIRHGAAAWAWDSQHIAWQGNEVALNWQGQSLRIDRLVQRRDDASWWVLDYKSAAQPQGQAGLRRQLQQYRQAVQAACPGERVHAAFLTGQGELVALPPEGSV
ncbi:MAG: putative ATP-dependent nuclease subunit [Pseudomonadota bacterium]